MHLLTVKVIHYYTHTSVDQNQMQAAQFYGGGGGGGGSRGSGKGYLDSAIRKLYKIIN